MGTPSLTDSIDESSTSNNSDSSQDSFGFFVLLLLIFLFLVRIFIGGICLAHECRNNLLARNDVALSR